MYLAILAKIGGLFPAVTHLQFSCLRREEFEFLLRTKAPPFPKLTALSFIDRYQQIEDLPQSLSSSILRQVSRLEFRMATWTPTFGTSLLKIFAPFLQHLDIEIENWRTAPDGQEFFDIPIMPRLQVFKINRSAFSGNGGWIKVIKFETEDLANNVMINYAKQFPVLAALSVNHTNRGESEKQQGMYFERTVQFLCNSFTPWGNRARCETLRELDIPLPPVEMFWLRGLNYNYKVEGEDKTCRRYGGNVLPSFCAGLLQRIQI